MFKVKHLIQTIVQEMRMEIMNSIAIENLTKSVSDLQVQVDVTTQGISALKTQVDTLNAAIAQQNPDADAIIQQAADNINAIIAKLQGA